MVLFAVVSSESRIFFLLVPLLASLLLRGVKSLPFFFPLVCLQAGEAKALPSLLPLAAEEGKRLPLPLATAEPLPPPLGERVAEPLPLPLAAAEPLSPPLGERVAEPLTWAFPARGAEPTPLPAKEVRASAWRAERRGGVLVVLVALRVGLTLGVEPGVGPGNVRRRSEERVARFGRAATAKAAGDRFRAARALAELFELVLLLGMFEGVSREDGQKCRGTQNDGSGAEW